MSNYKQQPSKNTIIPAPVTATKEFCQATEKAFIEHFATVLTPSIMIAHRKGAYATVINATVNGIQLDQAIGTVYAKELTEAVLNGISQRFSAVEVK